VCKDGCDCSLIILRPLQQRIWTLQNVPQERPETSPRKSLFGFFGGGGSGNSGSRRMSISGPSPAVAALSAPAPIALSNR
jgi:hypothetical protein